MGWIRKVVALAAILLAGTVLLAGCDRLAGRSIDLDRASSTVRPPAGGTNVATADDPGSPSRSGIAPPAPGGAALSAPAVFQALAPSIVFVETPLSTGTGIVVDDSRVVTNAHVLWPFDRARVVFPNGHEIASAAVAGVDQMGDLAVLELAPNAAASGGAVPVRASDGSALPIGSDVYLIGYPAEVEAFPQPTLTRGILSRVRTWEALSMRFLQTDADLAGGQSGGALAAADGTVIGVSSMIFGEEAFGLAMAMPDVMARVDRLPDAGGPAFRALPPPGSRTSQQAALDHAWSEAVYVVSADFGTDVEVEASSFDPGVDVVVQAVGPYGDLVSDDESTHGASDGGFDSHGPGSAIAFTTDADGPFFVVVSADPGGTVDVRANVPLARLTDPDDGMVLAPAPSAGNATADAIPNAPSAAQTAAMDFPGDVDAFSLTLREGQTAGITVETLNFAPEIIVDHPARPELAPPASDTTFPNPLGLAARAVFTAGADTTFVVIVRDLDAIGTGGYFIRVEIE